MTNLPMMNRHHQTSGVVTSTSATSVEDTTIGGSSLIHSDAAAISGMNTNSSSKNANEGPHEKGGDGMIATTTTTTKATTTTTPPSGGGGFITSEDVNKTILQQQDQHAPSTTTSSLKTLPTLLSSSSVVCGVGPTAAKMSSTSTSTTGSSIPSKRLPFKKQKDHQMSSGDGDGSSEQHAAINAVAKAKPPAATATAGVQPLKPANTTIVSSSSTSSQRQFQQQHPQQGASRYVKELRSCDVLLGRGTGPNEHSGNRSFRDHIYKLKDDYTKADCRQGKDDLAMETINAVKAKGGRFLKKLVPPKGSRGRGHYYGGSFCDLYEIADHDTILEKTRQAFQYCCRQRNGSSNKQKGSTMKGAVNITTATTAPAAIVPGNDSKAKAGGPDASKIVEGKQALQHIVDPDAASSSTSPAASSNNSVDSGTANPATGGGGIASNDISSPRVTAAAATVAAMSMASGTAQADGASNKWTNPSKEVQDAAVALARVLQHHGGGGGGGHLGAPAAALNMPPPYHHFLQSTPAAAPQASIESHFAAAAAMAASEAAFYRDLALAEHFRKQQTDVSMFDALRATPAVAASPDSRLLAAILAAAAPKNPALPGVGASSGAAGSLFGNLLPTASIAASRPSLFLEEELARLARFGGSALPPHHQLLYHYGASPAPATTATATAAAATAAVGRSSDLLLLAEELVRQREETAAVSATSTGRE